MTGSTSYIVIIPSRYHSTRLPGKALLDIKGKPLIQHVYETAIRCNANSVYIATDNNEIKDRAESFGASVIITSADHRSGTERIAEAVNILNIDDDTVIVNLQGDEIGMPPELLDQVAEMLIKNPNEKMATICEPLAVQKEIEDPNIVKVVFDVNQHALYFSRSVIPYHKSNNNCFYKHIGLYAYRAGFLRYFIQLPQCELEMTESLEQLKVLYHGFEILTGIACKPAGIGVDTENDLLLARNQIQD